MTFPRNVEQFDKTSICLSDVQGNKLKVYGAALLNYGVHDVGGNVIPWLEYNLGNHAVSVT